MVNAALHQKFELFFKEYKLLQYKKRAMILNSNDATSSVFYIRSGYVRVFRLSEDGEELTLAILKEHDFFPLTYGIGSSTHQYYLEAITPLELWKAPQELFTDFVKKDPELFYELTNRLLIRFDGVLARIESMVFSNAYTKVATILLMCAKGLGEEDNGQIIVKVPLTHKDIATMIGITRETTSLEMKKLERKGLVKHQGRNLVIDDYKKLEAEAMQNAPTLVATLPTLL